MSSCGDHHHHHEHTPPPESDHVATLWSVIDHDNISCLNERVPESAKKCVRDSSTMNKSPNPIECTIFSDSDDELLLYIPFTGSIKLHSILIRAPDGDDAPDTIKLFKNRPGMDFNSASDVKPDAIIHHPRQSNGAQVVEYAVKRSIFSNITSITLFTQDNHGADSTTLYYVGFKGDFKPLIKDPVITIYEAAPNPADHKIKGVAAPGGYSGL